LALTVKIPRVLRLLWKSVVFCVFTAVSKGWVA
jgi:hypothetical protein